MAETKTFETYAEAGAFLKDRNPGKIMMDTEEAARRFEAKNPHLMKVLEGTPMMERVGNAVVGGVNAASRVLGAIPGAKTNPLDIVSAGANALSGSAGFANQTAQDMGAGIASGGSLGLTEQLSQGLGNKPSRGLAFGAGEMVGEMMGPYKAAQGVLGLTKLPAMMGGATGFMGALGRAGLGGIESAAVEVPKSLIRGEEADEAALHGAIGFGAGTVFPLALRGAYVGLRGAAKKWLGPSEGEIDMELLNFLREEDISTEGLASTLRPTSEVVAAMQKRTMQSSATRKIYNAAREKLITSIDKMRDRISLSLGDNVTALPPSEVGAKVAANIEDSVKILADAKNAAYDKVGLSEIGKIPIKPNARLEFNYPDADGNPTETVTTSLLEGLERIIGKDVISGASPASSTATRKLLATYKWMKKNATSVEKEGFTVENPNMPDPLNRSLLQRKKTVDGGEVVSDPVSLKTPLEDVYVNPVQRNMGGAGDFVAQSRENVVYKDYNWWWNRAKEIGDMLDQRSVVESATDRKMVGQAYHLIRDVIDNHAESIGNENYTNAIKIARSSHINYTSFKNHPMVKKIKALAYLDDKTIAVPEKIMPMIFDGVSSIREVKHLLGPNTFSQVRQSWIHSLLQDAIEIESNGTLKTVNAKKLMKTIQKYGGMDGETMPEMFSDQGFFTPDGMELLPTGGGTQAPIKFEEFKKFVKNVGLLNDASELMSHAGQPDVFGGSAAERFGGGRMTNLQGIKESVQAAVASMVTARKGAQELMKPYGESIFLGGMRPEKASIDIPLNRLRKSPMQPNSRPAITEKTMSQGSSALLNRLFKQ